MARAPRALLCTAVFCFLLSYFPITLRGCTKYHQYKFAKRETMLFMHIIVQCHYIYFSVIVYILRNIYAEVNLFFYLKQLYEYLHITYILCKGNNNFIYPCRKFITAWYLKCIYLHFWVCWGLNFAEKFN